MRDADNIRAVANLGIDMIGFVFCKESLRYVSMISSKAGGISDYNDERLNKKHNKDMPVMRPQCVGIFVDDMPQNIVTCVYNYDLDYVQLNGAESGVMIENLRNTLVPDIKDDIKIIKALRIGTKADIEAYKEYEGKVDMFLFDMRFELVDDGEKQVNWSILNEYDGQTPFLLGGAVGPDDVERIKSFRHPMFVGVDLNNLFEIAPGVKDIEKLRIFIENVR